MAKRIKKIVCPQCGSNRVNETKIDYFVCKSCNTQFILDSEDIVINHRYPTNEKGVELIGGVNKYVIICSMLAFLLGLLLLPFIFSIEDKRRSTPREVYTSSEVKKKTEKQRFASLSSSEGALVADDKGNELIVFTGIFFDFYELTSDQNSLYTIIIDPVTGEEISRSKFDIDLKVIGVGESSASVKYFRGANQELYLIVNSYYLFRFNTKRQSFDDISKTFYLKYSEFSEGVASVKYESFNQCLEVTTNIGKKYALYDYIEKVIPINKTYTMYDIKLPNPVKKTAYAFTTGSSDFPDEDIQLLEYVYYTQKGYPLYYVTFGWSKDYGGSGIFTDASPYKKVLILPYNKQKARIVSIRDFAPKHFFPFSGTVVYSDDEYVLITFKTSIVKGETLTMQKLRVKDGSIVWTKKTNWEYIDYAESINETEHSILLPLGQQKMVLIGREDGETIKEIDLNDYKVIGKNI